MKESFFYPYLSLLHKTASRRKGELFLVGGAVRDALLGRESSDLDFAVERGAVSFAETFSKKIHGAFVLLDKEHGCARVVKKHRGMIYTFDFADFRGPSFHDDIRNRDFSINTFAVDMRKWTEGPLADQALDLCSARQDLDSRLIRMASEAAFTQDPLRLIRAFALRATLGFSIEKATRSRVRRDRMLIRESAPERIRDELFKILESDRAGLVLKEMDRAGILEMIIPQVRIMFGVAQGTYHHLDVWPHALETVKQLEGLVKGYCGDAEMFAYLNQPIAGNRSRKALLKLACLLHDAGKPETRRREGSRIRFHGHEHAGRVISHAVSKQLKLSAREGRVLGDMVQLHLRPGYLSNVKRPGPRAVFRYFRDAGKEAVSVALLARADQRATRGPLTTLEGARHHDEICLGLIARYFELCQESPRIPLINGDDLIQILRLKPSPLFSKILKDVQEAQAEGVLKTKEQALDRARKIAGLDKIRDSKGLK